MSLLLISLSKAEKVAVSGESGSVNEGTNQQHPHIEMPLYPIEDLEFFTDGSDDDNNGDTEEENQNQEYSGSTPMTLSKPPHHFWGLQINPNQLGGLGGLLGLFNQRPNYYRPG